MISFEHYKPNKSYKKCGLGKTSNNPFEWDDFREIAKQSLLRSDKKLVTGENRSFIFQRALSTSDYKAILENISTKLVANGWTNLPVSYPDWTKAVELKDFRDATIISSSAFSTFTKIPEGQEIPQGDFSIEASLPFRLETFARIFSIHKHAYMMDDLEVIKTAPMLMGASVRQFVEENVFNLLLSNPVLSDGIALFHADHNNLISRCFECC